jgi:hypothetical protein
MVLLRIAFAALLVVNAVPHLAKGLTGQRHQTPRRFGDSAVANAIWGWVNAVAAVAVWPAGHLHGSRWPAVAVGAAASLVAAVGLSTLWQRHPERNLPHEQG